MNGACERRGEDCNCTTFAGPLGDGRCCTGGSTPEPAGYINPETCEDCDGHEVDITPSCCSNQGGTWVCPGVLRQPAGQTCCIHCPNDGNSYIVMLTKQCCLSGKYIAKDEANGIAEQCCTGDKNPTNGYCCASKDDNAACCHAIEPTYEWRGGKCVPKVTCEDKCKMLNEAGTECITDPSKVDTEAECCSNAGRQWASNESEGHKCCLENSHNSSGYCCSNSPVTEYDSAAGMCCDEPPEPSYACYQSVSAAPGVCPTYGPKCTSTDCNEDTGDCCSAATPIYVSAIKACCNSDGTNSPECCKNKGRDWASSENNGNGRCCGTNEHVSNGICCPQNYHETEGHCCADGISADAEENWVDGVCCPKSKVSGIYCCSNHNDNEIAGCCTKQGKTYYANVTPKICCKNENESEACCLAAHSTGYQ